MQASSAAYVLIRDFEGLSTKAYVCPAGYLTIGYGHTAGVNPGDTITPAQAEVYLKADIANVENKLNKSFKNLTQGQFDALVSFIFNLGYGTFSISTLCRKIQEGDMTGAAREFDRWIYATDPKTGVKVKLQGLIKRRAAERKLFES